MPKRQLPLSLDSSAEEVDLVRSLKRRELRLGADEVVICEGHDVNARARLADLYGDGRPPQRPLVWSACGARRFIRRAVTSRA